ncbi:uncharacterized protein LY89DRAFT_726969 [Mollisia scopiformis]|uniref:Uncharacterized protein n=1 Tax=Mollisia scopiformis TaxID=149040 RepID=A0A194XV64_MOLSC|nr:uncharacterized protein LY89DRAFT_726969 [Mollisia scopiformis]KUJ23919.1 hypothetical protein LY89DRAFT_726969 [Mollisia scopiformis]
MSDIREVSMRVIVGIDVGLTCTGVAICTDFDAPSGRETHVRVIEQWPGAVESVVKKVPTRVAYTAGELGIHSWGFGCPELSDLGGGRAIKDMFKFFLDTSYVKKKFGQGPQAPKPENVRLWYKDFLTAIYTHIVQELRDEPKIDFDSPSTSVEFVFSIPTEWKDKDDLVREFRDIVDDAGFGKTGQVHMDLTEGEAAAVFTANKLNYTFQQGEAFMVLDAGGGTTDMCILQVNSPLDDVLELETVDEPRALPAGSVNIDELFEKRARELLWSTNGVAHDKVENLALQMSRGKFQDIKTLFGTDSFRGIKIVRLQVPDSTESITFHLAELKTMFDSQIDMMIEAINKQLSLLRSVKPYVRVSYLFLAGGLGSSKYVQDRLVEQCQKTGMEVLFAPKPEDLPLAVCQGLVIDRVQHVCQDRSVIPIRSSNSSYGILYKELYSEKHSGQSCTRNRLDGKDYAENQIDWLIMKGSQRRGQVVPRFYSILADPALKKQSWGFTIIRSTADARSLPIFLDDKGSVEIVGHVVSSPEVRLHTLGIAHKRGFFGRKTDFSRVNCRLSALIEVGKFEFIGTVVSQAEEKPQVLKVYWSKDKNRDCDLIRSM